MPLFVWVKRGRRVAYVHPECEPLLSEALLDGKGTSPSNLAGRGELLRCVTPKGRAVIRKNRRGGAVARILGDRYLLVNRPIKELTVHVFAWSKGVPTVMPLGAMWERSGLFLRGAIATLEADAEDLLHYLQHGTVPDQKVLSSCGGAIRSMHAAGIYHSDLQVKNILVVNESALIIDFDGARVTHVTPTMAASNLKRLKRSFIKRGLPLTAFDSIAAAYRHANESAPC